MTLYFGCFTDISLTETFSRHTTSFDYYCILTLTFMSFLVQYPQILVHAVSGSSLYELLAIIGGSTTANSKETASSLRKWAVFPYKARNMNIFE